MALMKTILLGLVSSWLLVSAQPQDTRVRRAANPLLNNLVGGLARPFLSLFGGGGSSSGEKRKPRRPSHHSRPSYSYSQQPLALHSGYYVPQPVKYHQPSVSHHPTPAAPAPAPAYQPEIHVLPAPDLTSYVKEPEQYAAPAVSSYEPPAVAPAYESDSPAIAPAYEPPVPTYQTDTVPVYTPAGQFLEHFSRSTT